MARGDARDRMLHRLGNEIVDGLEEHNHYFVPEGTGYVRDFEDGIKADLKFLDTSVERPEPTLDNAKWVHNRRVQIEVKITEVGPPVPEIVQGNIRIGRGDESEGDDGEYVIYIKSSFPSTGWDYLTDAISEGYAEARKDHPEWPEVVSCDIGEFRGTLFYMSGPVPVESLVKVHELYVAAREAAKR